MYTRQPLSLSEDKQNTHRAVSPALERAVIAGLDGLDRNILVPSEWRDDGGLVRKRDLVLGVWGEQALEDGRRRVEHSRTFAADLDADVDLFEVDDLSADAANARRRVGVEVHVAEVRAELVSLDVAERCTLRRAGLVRDGVLVALAAVAITGQDDDAVNFGVRHRRVLATLWGWAGEECGAEDAGERGSMSTGFKLYVVTCGAGKLLAVRVPSMFAG